MIVLHDSHFFKRTEDPMNLHEYQSKLLLRKYDVPVLYGVPVFNADEAGRLAYSEFVQKGISTVVVKSQIHAGGRGKGHIVSSATGDTVLVNDEPLRGVTVLSGGNLAHSVYDIVNSTLNNILVTVQTGPSGKRVNRMFIEEGCSIAHEYYCSILLDRQSGRNVIMVSEEGGMDIETVAEESPEKILRETIDPNIGLRPFQLRRLAYGLNLSGSSFKSFVSFIDKLYKAYEQLDCNLLEVNPLVRTTADSFVALDAKITVDDNALYRHPEIEVLRDTDEEDALEVEAGNYNLNYIKLDGNVGCMVNGAGLAMATMDIIQLAGGKPANFLDVGGGANVERIANAFRIMLSDQNVQAVLINIFGGIVRCDRVANGILEAMKIVSVTVPVIVRLDGTNAQEARAILESSGMDFLVATTLSDAADKVTQALDTVSIALDTANYR